MTMKEKLKKLSSVERSNWIEEAEEDLRHAGARLKAWKLALRVLALLREKGLTQAQLAKKMGVTRQQVSKIVKGKENFTFETVDKLEKALGETLMTIAEPDKQASGSHDISLGNLHMAVRVLDTSRFSLSICQSGSHIMSHFVRNNPYIDLYSSLASYYGSFEMQTITDAIHQRIEVTGNLSTDLPAVTPNYEGFRDVNGDWIKGKDSSEVGYMMV